MGQHKNVKPRTCKTCKGTFVVDADGLKAHGAACIVPPPALQDPPTPETVAALALMEELAKP